MFDYLKKIIEHIRQISDSIDEYKKLSPSGAMPSVAQVNKALKLLRRNKIEEAETLLLEAEELHPASEVVYRTLGYLYEIRHDFEKAANYFQKALNLNPIQKDLFMRLGYAQLSAHDNEGACRTFERGVKVFKADSEVITGYGMALYRLEKFEKARIELVKAFSLDSHNLNALFLIATIDIMFEDYERAETRLSLLVKLAPNTAHLYEYAKLKKLKQDYGEAFKLSLQTLKTNKYFLPAYLLIAEIHHLQDKNDEALAWIKKAEDEELFDASLYFSRANICMYKEDFASALEAYRKVLEFQQDKTVDMKILICEILLDKIEGKEEIVQLMSADVESEVDNERKAVTYMLLGVWNYKIHNLIKAEEFFRKALQVTLKLPIVYYLMAKIYCELVDDYKADKYFALTIEKNPNNYNAYKDYVGFLMERERYEDARFKIRKALKFFPEDQYLENCLFYTGFRLLDEHSAQYNVKELLKLAEKLEKNSTFLYANERDSLLEKIKY